MIIKLKERSPSPDVVGYIELIFIGDELVIENTDGDIVFDKEEIPILLKMFDKFKEKYEKIMLLK